MVVVVLGGTNKTFFVRCESVVAPAALFVCVAEEKGRSGSYDFYLKIYIIITWNSWCRVARAGRFVWISLLACLLSCLLA